MSSKRIKMDTNFYINNNLAFTRGTHHRVLITNVLVEKIGDDQTEDDLKNYFKCFGEIAELTFNEKELYNTRSANVIFKGPNAATNALLFEDHKNFTVTANDTWLQPLLNDSDQRLPTIKSTILTELDDDSLLKIISLLDLKDQLALLCSHERFLNPFQMFAKTELKLVKIDLQCLSAWQIYQFFNFAGEYIEDISISFNDDIKKIENLCRLMLKNCENLKTLMVSQMKNFNTKFLNVILSNKTNLIKLVLYDCSIRDECSTAISSLQQLEVLTMAFCDNITGRNLLLLNLKELNIIQCENLSAKHMTNTISQMPMLSKLSLVDNHNNLTSIVENLPRICKNLEVLSLNCPFASYGFIYKLKKLRSMEFVNFGSKKDVLTKFVDKKCNQIETLVLNCFYLKAEHKHLISKLKNLKFLRLNEATDDHLKPLYELFKLETIDLSHSNITNNGLLELVRCCQNLKYINIEDTAINNKFTEALLHFIKQRKQQNGQLIFFVRCSAIEKWKLSKEYSTMALKSLVKFQFMRSKSDGFHEMFSTFNILGEE